MTKCSLTPKEFADFEDKTINQVKEWTDYLIKSGIRRTSWTLTNDFVVTCRDLKRKARTK